MVEAGGSWSIGITVKSYEAHFRAGIAPVLADGRREGAGWVLQAQILTEVQYLVRDVYEDGLDGTEKTTGLSGRLGLEASHWSRGTSAFTTRLSVGGMVPLRQDRGEDWNDYIEKSRDLHWAMDVALDLGIASH